jgi:hypothetical protein
MSNGEEEIIKLSLASKGPHLLLALNGEVSGAENIDEILLRCWAGLHATSTDNNRARYDIFFAHANARCAHDERISDSSRNERHDG